MRAGHAASAGPGAKTDGLSPTTKKTTDCLAPCAMLHGCRHGVKPDDPANSPGWQKWPPSRTLGLSPVRAQRNGLSYQAGDIIKIKPVSELSDKVAHADSQRVGDDLKFVPQRPG